jgi:hypothetical protein
MPIELGKRDEGGVSGSEVERYAVQPHFFASPSPDEPHEEMVLKACCQLEMLSMKKSK